MGEAQDHPRVTVSQASIRRVMSRYRKLRTPNQAGTQPRLSPTDVARLNEQTIPTFDVGAGAGVVELENVIARANRS